MVDTYPSARLPLIYQPCMLMLYRSMHTLGIFYLPTLALCSPNLPTTEFFLIYIAIYCACDVRSTSRPSGLLLWNSLSLASWTLPLQLKSLFLFIIGQNKCTCKVIKNVLSCSVELYSKRNNHVMSTWTSRWLFIQAQVKIT